MCVCVCVCMCGFVCVDVCVSVCVGEYKHHSLIRWEDTRIDTHKHV